MKSLLIYIPTRGRVGWKRQVTLREFLANSSYKPILVCPPEESRLHKEYHKHVRSCPVYGIGPTRQWILDNSTADIVVMADDDLYFYHRPEPTNVYLARSKALDPMIDLVRLCIDMGYAHGGLSNNQHNRGRDLSIPSGRRGVIDQGHLWMDNYRVNNFMFFDRQKVLDQQVRFDPVMVMEDFHVTLSLLTKGIPNRLIYSYSWNHVGSNAEGGCSLYRTPELQTEGARILQATFPQFVKLTTKECKEDSTFWKGMKERTDVVIKWDKAFKSSTVSQAPT